MNNSIRACYGRDIDEFCLIRQLLPLDVAAESLLLMFDNIFLVNVSTVTTVQYRAARALSSLASIPVN